MQKGENSAGVQDSSTLQIQQKLIHYKSELRRYENIIQNYESQLEKERTNAAYLKSLLKSKKLYKEVREEEGQSSKYKEEINALRKELGEQKKYRHELQNSFQAKIEEQKKINQLLIMEIQKLNEKRMEKPEEKSPSGTGIDIAALFSYSLILPSKEDEADGLAIGTLQVRNTGNLSLSSPIICIKVRPVGAVQLTGKLHSNEESKNERSEGRIFDKEETMEWLYAHPNWKERIKQEGEYWIKPKDVSKIEPGESLFFENFTLNLPYSLSNSSLVAEGFFYCREMNKGVPVSNKIIVNF